MITMLNNQSQKLNYKTIIILTYLTSRLKINWREEVNIHDCGLRYPVKKYLGPCKSRVSLIIFLGLEQPQFSSCPKKNDKETTTIACP